MDRFVFLLPVLMATCVAVQADRPPNILFIMADDLGFNDVSWHNEQVKTPNLQYMAENGVILEQSYSQAACTPSRAAYLTGVYPFRLGVQNSVVREGMADYVPLDVTFLPQRLKEAGYSTHLVGKWHLGHCRRDVTPPGRGFDTFLGLLNGYNDYYTKKIRPIASHEDFDPNAPGTIYDFFSNYTLQPSSDTEYTTDIFTARAQELIKLNKDRPFYLALHYTAPHWPLQYPPVYDENDYKDVEDEDRRKYLTMLTAMDTGIGKVMQTLKEEQLTRNTLVIFQSDNGGDTHFAASNDPLRERKTTLYEGGLRVPSLAFGPGLLANTPRVSKDLFHIVDWFSTLLGAAGVEPGNVDGVNQWNLLRYGSDGPRKVFIYNIHGNNGAIRVGRFKLIEGDAGAFQARRRRSAHGSAAVQPATCNKDYATSRHPQSKDVDKVMEAFTGLSGLKNIQSKRRSGDWTLRKILNYLESFNPDDVSERADCTSCQLYDLDADPSETKNLVEDLPAVTLYLYNLLELYKLEEVRPVLEFPYKKDPRFQELNYTDNTWCEESAIVG